MSGLIRLRRAGQGLAVVAAVVVMVGSQAGAQAAQQNNGVETIGLTPASRSLKADAGKTIESSMEVINNGDAAFDFQVYARPYGVIDEKYNPDFSGKYSYADAYKWVKFEKTEYSLKPGQKVEVPYTLAVPAGAAPGGHYGVVFAETKAAPIGDTGVARQKRVGQILFATVNGTFRTGGTIAGFSLPFRQGQPPLQSSVRITNTGNINLDTKSSTVAKDLFGRTKFTFTGSNVVLPETTRLVEMNWDKVPNFGVFRVTQTAQFLGQEHVHQGWVVMAPRWFIILAIVILLAGVGYAVHKNKWLKRRR